jgi:hypothetical protein
MWTFGAKVHNMHKERGKKLDHMDSKGKFMTFKGTDKIAYVIDSKMGQECTTTHIAYNKVYSATPRLQTCNVHTNKMSNGINISSSPTSNLQSPKHWSIQTYQITKTSQIT